MIPFRAHGIALLLVGTCLLQLSATAVEAGRRQRRAGDDPMMADFEYPVIRSPWGVGIYQDFGAHSFQSGAFDELLETGPTFGFGAKWKAAEYEGDLLPPSETHFKVGYRYAYLKGDSDFQTIAPDGIIRDIEKLRIHMLEGGANQRFDNLYFGGRGFIEVGTSLGLGIADGAQSVAPLTPGKTLQFIEDHQEDGFITRGELSLGTGISFDYFSVDGTVFAGLAGTDALTGKFQAHSDAGIRLNFTFYFDPR
ncbi:MAG: hypothetical protein R3B90_05930 [Planctomycetaceae bacterium]